MSMRLRQTQLLLGPVISIVPWAPIAAAVAVSVLALLPAAGGAQEPASQVWGLRIAAVVLGVGASFAMVDPMEPLSVTPTPRWLRQWLRTVVVLLPTSAVWLALFLLAASSATADRLPLADLASEAIVCGLAGLVGAAVAARRGHSLTAAVAGPATQGGLMVATLFLSGTRSPWQLPGAAEWGTVHAWWWGVVPFLVAAMLAANRDLWPLRRAARGPARERAGDLAPTR